MTCDHCGQPATRTLCAETLCHQCAETILQPIRYRVGLTGSGMLAGIYRPEYGPGVADLECGACGATWVGVVGDPCTWCEDRAENQRRWQAELVLQAPLHDRDDPRRRAALEAWAQRLATAVQAGIIDRHEADRAWKRALK